MQFFNQYGVGMGQPIDPKLFYQPMPMLNAPSGRVIQPSGGFGGGGAGVDAAGVAAMIAGTPSPMPTAAGGAPVAGAPPVISPGGSTPPWNPNGSVSPMGATPPPVTGPPEPAGVPNAAVTVDQEGNIETGDPLVDAVTTSSQQPLTYYLDEEEPTKSERLQAGFLMMSAAGTPQFGRTAALANAALQQRTQQARKRNDQLRAMTRDREWVEGATKDGYYKVKQPAIATLSEDGKSITLLENPPGQEREWVSNTAPEKKTVKLADGITYYMDDPVFDEATGKWKLRPVDQGQLDRYNRSQGRGDLTPTKAAEELQEQQATMREILPNYLTLQKTLRDGANPFADVTTLFAFMKTIDPGSVVRANEADMFSNAGSLPTQLANALNKVTNGGSLTNAQQLQLSKIVDELMLGQVQEAKRARKNWDDFFAQPAQVADGWDSSVLNPYDILYNRTIEQDITDRLNGDFYSSMGSGGAGGGQSGVPTLTWGGQQVPIQPGQTAPGQQGVNTITQAELEQLELEARLLQEAEERERRRQTSVIGIPD